MLQEIPLKLLRLKNVGLVPLAIKNTKHTGPNSTDFTTISGGGAFTLAPGETHLMHLNFKASQIGLTNGNLEFEFAGIGSPATITLLGEGVKEYPEISTFCPAPYKLSCANSHVDSVKIWNIGGGLLDITEIYLDGANANEFHIISNPAPVVIDNDTAVTIVFSFNPTSTGAKEANLRIKNNSNNAPLHKVELYYDWESSGFEVPSSLDFGEIQNLIESEHKFVIHNTGTSANTYVISTTSIYFYTLTHNVSIGPGGSDTVTFRYNGESNESGIGPF